ncbi:MAG TPA: ankyrin repeat domain-containing protein [Blastocatellia bacterium]|nr:ankyrin repeat domain-containing protein [Blastocatellia bacterium]
MSGTSYNNRSIGPILGIMILLQIGFATACNRQVATESGRAEHKSSSTPIPLVTTEQNQGKRCDARDYYYADPIEPEDIENATIYRACYSLQERLVEAAFDGNLTEIREALKYGANPNGYYSSSDPPLIAAAFEGKLDAVILLLDNGADINHIRDFQNTALNSAASEGHTDVVKVLIDRGADICYTSFSGTAEDIARDRGFAETANVLKAARPFGCQWTRF